MIIVFLKENLNVFKIYCNSFSKRSYCEEFKCGGYELYSNRNIITESSIKLISDCRNNNGEFIITNNKSYWRKFFIIKDFIGNIWRDIMKVACCEQAMLENILCFWKL